MMRTETLNLEPLEDRCLLSGFSISNGQIIDPNGNVFVARGINYPDDGGLSNPNQVLNLFPGINFVRLAASNFPSAASMENFVNTLTAAHVVVEIEDHNYPSSDPYSGAALTTEDNWFVSLAATFQGNPYVWFGSQNEPQSANGLTAEEVSVYNAIRAQGNNNPIMLQAGVDGSDPGATGPVVLDPSAYVGMHNVIWDIHFYGAGVPNESTDQTIVNSTLLGNTTDTGIRAAQQITDADGVIPVIVGEVGPSADGRNVDPNSQQAIFAATNWAISNGLTSGFAGWYFGTDPNDPNSMTLDGTSLTASGQEVRTIIQNPLALPMPASPPAPVPPPFAEEVELFLDGAKLFLSLHDANHVLPLPSVDAIFSDIRTLLPQAGPWGIPALLAGVSAAEGALQASNS